MSTQVIRKIEDKEVRHPYYNYYEKKIVLLDKENMNKDRGSELNCDKGTTYAGRSRPTKQDGQVLFSRRQRRLDGLVFRNVGST